MYDANTTNTTKKIRYRRNVHIKTKTLSATKLKCLLKIYLRKRDNEQVVFGHIINLSNRMYQFI